MATGIEFKVAVDELRPALRRLERLGRDATPVMRSMGTTFKSITQGNFNSAGSALRPKAWKAKWDGSPSILQKSGTLKRSFHLTVGPHTATVGTPVKYAAVHQLGKDIFPKKKKMLSWIGAGKKRVFAKKVTMPARPFFPVMDGELTAAAGVLIGRAGARTAEKMI